MSSNMDSGYNSEARKLHMSFAYPFDSPVFNILMLHNVFVMFCNDLCSKKVKVVLPNSIFAEDFKVYSKDSLTYKVYYFYY